MNLKLFIQAIVKFFAGVIIVGAFLFVSANTFKYWNAWLLLGLLFIPMFIAGIVLMINNPELLKKRLNGKEKELEQKLVLMLSGLMFALGFLVAGLNFRYKWIEVPNWVVIVGSVLFIIAYILYAEVMRENTYLSRTIEVQEDQKVIDTGMYKIVRHPMYMVTLLLFLSIPLILGSLISLVIFLMYPIIIAIRIKNEEKVLERDLKGYKEYKEKVKHRLIPFIW